MKKSTFIFLVSLLYFVPTSFSQSTISGRVFSDASGNSSYDAGEELANIKVWLFDMNAVAPYYRVRPIDSVVSNGSGIYTFSSVPAGDYQVRVMQTSVPATITRSILDNDSYPNGITELSGVDGASAYSNIDFGFAPTATAPSFTSLRNFQWNATNSFINTLSQTYTLTPEVIGGTTVTPTLTVSTDRQIVYGGSDVYPHAVDPSSGQVEDWPGNLKGGIHPTDKTYQFLGGGDSYTAINNDQQTTTIQFSDPVINTKFSMYDIDHADPQRATGRIDHVKVTGYNGAVPVMPVILNPSAAPWNTVSGNTIFGFADYPLSTYTQPFNSANEDHGTVNVYFQSAIDKIVIEYEEWAPVMLPGKGILDNTPADNALLNNEAKWVNRSGVTAPTYRGISIGSIDYTVQNLVVLPVNLIDFKVTGNNCSVILNWKTSYEQNLNGFEIEYAADGSHFQSTGKVTAKNNSTGADYSYSIPANFTNGYYRLKISDNDGKFQYSEIKSINGLCLKNISWSLSPNPINNSKDLTINLFKKEGLVKNANVIIWDLNGQKLLQQPVSINPGQNIYSIKTSNLKPGTYLVGMYDEVNKTTGEIQKLIVQ